MAEGEQASTGTKSTTRKSAGKKSTAKKSTAKKSAGKKTTTKQSAAKKSSDTAGGGRRQARAPQSEPSRPASGGRLAFEAARQLAELTGKEVEGVVGLQKGENGWQVEVELLELRRVPSTTDVLAVYEVDVDTSGDLQGYRRDRRYVRGQAEGQS